MQSVSSRIWTRVAMFISYDNNNYTTGTSTTIIQSSPLCFPLPLLGAVSGLLYVQGTLAYRLPRPSGLMYQCSCYLEWNLTSALAINQKRSYFQCLIMKLFRIGPMTSNLPPSGSIPPQQISIAPRSCLFFKWLSISSTEFVESLYTACTQCKVPHLVPPDISSSFDVSSSLFGSCTTYHKCICSKLVGHSCSLPLNLSCWGSLPPPSLFYSFENFTLLRIFHISVSWWLLSPEGELQQVSSSLQDSS